MLFDANVMPHYKTEDICKEDQCHERDEHEEHRGQERIHPFSRLERDFETN
jgi:hypothetical protein